MEVTKQVEARAGDGKSFKRRSSFEPEFIDIKHPPSTRLERLFTEVRENKDELIILKTYRDREGRMFTYRKVTRSDIVKPGVYWQWINQRIHPVIPYSGD